MEGKILLKDLIKGLKRIRRGEWVAIVLALAIFLSLYTSSFWDNKGKNKHENSKNEILDSDDPTSQEDPTEVSIESREEARLREVLSVIKGAGRVEVMITYYSGREIVTAMNTIESSTSTEEEDNNGGSRKVIQSDRNSQPVTFNDNEGSKPIIIKEVEPEVKGVVVISEGASDIRVKMELIRAVQVALGVNPNQVEVFPMEEISYGE